jgi:hypothetical protein
MRKRFYGVVRVEKQVRSAKFMLSDLVLSLVEASRSTAS